MRAIIVSLVLVLLATLGVFVAARNVINKPSSSQVVQEKKACELISVDELIEVMGAQPVVEDKSEPTKSICLAITEEKVLTLAIQNSEDISDFTGGSITSASQYYDQQLENTETPGIIEDLGNKAFWDGGQLWALNGDYLINIVYDDLTKARDVAGKAISRL